MSSGVVLRMGGRGDEGAALASLLDAAFPDTFEGRVFFKQQPHARVMAFAGDVLIGQVGLDFRVIRVGDDLIEIVGLIDLCVAPHMRGQGVASRLLRAAEDCAAGRGFAVLMADDPRLYVRHGYVSVSPAQTRWFVIEDLESHSVMERDLGDCFMVKSLQGASWPTGKIDLLGYLF